MKSRSTTCDQWMEAENDQENRIIGQAFDREKVRALKIAVKLECLIAETQLDEGVGEAEAMAALKL
jgi:hypothetical protein